MSIMRLENNKIDQSQGQIIDASCLELLFFIRNENNLKIANALRLLYGNYESLLNFNE